MADFIDQVRNYYTEQKPLLIVRDYPVEAFLGRFRCNFIGTWRM